MSQAAANPIRVRRKDIVVTSALLVLLVVLGAITAYVYVPAIFGAGSSKIDSTWVSEFIGGVDMARTSQGNQAIVLESNLTVFAELRANNLTAHYEITHYGFVNDTSRFLKAKGSLVSEMVVYPEDASPATMVKYEEQHVPGVWGPLLASKMYGYSIAQGPYYLIANGQSGECEAAFIPPNVSNITQFLQSQGCHFTVVNTTWLVFEVSNGTSDSSTA